MDKKIKQTKKALDKSMNSLLKTDIKNDKKMETCARKMKAKKKK